MRTTIGILIWLVLVSAGAWAVLHGRDNPAHDTAARLWAFSRAEPTQVVVSLPGRTAIPNGTPIMVRDSERFLRRVGTVSGAATRDGKTELELAIFPEAAARLTADTQATYLTVSGSAAWVVATLLPAERRAEIRMTWSEFYASQREAMSATLWPIVRRSLEQLFQFYESELPAVLARYRPELRSLIDVHRRGTFERELLPGAQAVAWPVAKQEFEPLVEQIVHELWDRLPVWGLSWRYAYEQIPLTDDDHVKERFRGFMERDAIPVLRAHSKEFLAGLGKVVRTTFRDPRVTAAMRKMIGEIVDDPRFLQLLQDLSRDLTIGNDRLRALIDAQWRDESVQQAFRDLGKRLEPLIDSTINSIALSPDRTRLSGRLAQVLRTAVLRKETTWVLLEPGESDQPLVAGTKLTGSLDDGR